MILRMKTVLWPARTLAFSIPLALLALPPFRVGAAAPPPEPLRVSAAGRFLVTEKGAPVFLLADTAWSLVNRLKREDIADYLRHRRGQGFNAVTFVLYATGDPNQADTGRNAHGQAPFAFAGGRPDPASPRVTPGSNPASAMEYDFWDHVDFAVAETKRQGLYAIVLPCWGSAVAGAYDGRPDAGIVFNEANARAYGRWLGGRYRGESHVIWMLGGDRSAHVPAKGWDYRPVFRALAAGLREGSPTALMSYHPKKSAPQSGDWFHDDAWLSFNSIQQWPEAQIAAITRDWNATPAKPTWIFEGRYEGYYKNNYKAADWGEWQCRQQAWQTVFAGAFGHTYGHERVFGFGTDGWDWRKELDAPGARCMTHLAAFMNSLAAGDLLSRVPDQTLIAGEEGKAGRLASDRLTAMRNGDGTLAMVYSANGRAIRLRVDRMGARRLDAFWFNPRTGRWRVGAEETVERHPFVAGLAAGAGAPVLELDPPGEPGDRNDWVLVLQKPGP